MRPNLLALMKNVRSGQTPDWEPSVDRWRFFRPDKQSSVRRTFCQHSFDCSDIGRDCRLIYRRDRYMQTLGQGRACQRDFLCGTISKKAHRSHYFDLAAPCPACSIDQSTRSAMNFANGLISLSMLALSSVLR